MADDLKPELVGTVRAQLGEGPSWDSESGTLFWVDIFGESLHSYRPAQDEEHSLHIGCQPGCVVMGERGGLVVVAENGVLELSRWPNGRLDSSRPIASLAQDTRLRFNDGKCDPQGRLWAGTMDREEREPLGTLYRITRAGGAEAMQDGVTVSNGLGWSPAGDQMYYIDSPRRKVWAYDFDPEAGTISGQRTLARFEVADGYPDGMTVDATGRLWIAFWEGGKVLCIDPETGQVLEQILLPASKVTSCSFGGADLDQMFITTARVGLEEDEEPLAGRLFVCRPGVKGVPSTQFSPR